MREHFVRVISPNEFQQDLLIYSDAMGFEENPGFYINRTAFNNYLVMYTVCGELLCRQNETMISVLPGEAVLLDLHQPHQYYFREGVPSKIAWAHINGPPAVSVMEQIQSKCALPVKLKLPAIYEYMLALFEISDKPTQDFFLQSELCYGILMIFLREVWNTHGNYMEDPRYQEFKQEVWQVIGHNLSRNISLDELAKSVSLSKYHFARTFREAFGASAMHFITEERIRQAKYRLRNTTQSVNSISEDLGFSAPGYFTKVFKKFCGCTPSEYREKE